MKQVFKNRIDWTLFLLTVPLLAAGLVTMNSFTGDNHFFTRQLVWIAVSFGVFFTLASIDIRFLRRTDVLVGFFLFFIFLLSVLFILGKVSHGAQSWFSLGGFSFQPSDMVKLVIILMLAKYFSRRHVEIRHWRHIFISGLYALIPFVLVFLQPDFGSAIIIFFIWFGMTLVSGISRKHILMVCGVGAVICIGLWLFVLQPYQKARVLTFVNPLSDVQGAGYNVYQSTIAVGSGQWFGKGVGYGTQSRLQFLPEYQTDFIFAAFAEEWGFVGVILLMLIFVFLIWRILYNALYGATNFEMLFGMGIVVYFISHIIINVGMNIGIAPVTGITLPFVSYGGSHLLTEFAALGILSSMRSYRRTMHRDDIHREFVGVEQL